MKHAILAIAFAIAAAGAVNANGAAYQCDMLKKPAGEVACYEY
ncbi:MAG: hypothetical protein AAF092_05015 [Pseudomonadota bacterium]